jgi:hypothetical protein
MSPLEVAVPLKLDQDVNRWNEDDVEMFLRANMKTYGLKDRDIQTVKNQRVCGIVLLDLDIDEFGSEGFGLLGGPAICFGMLVRHLKVAKKLVRGK